MDAASDKAETTARSGRSQKLVESVFDTLQACIQNGEFPPGSRLPPEHDLSFRLGVSRPIVREALKRLRDLDVVYSRQGSGTFVRIVEDEDQAQSLSFAGVRTIADIQRCYEFRLSLEPDAAFLAATRRNKAAVRKIRAALQQMRDGARDEADHSAANFLFHRTIAEASNNHYYLSCLDALRAHVGIGVQYQGRSTLNPTLQREAVFDEHNELCRAIEEGRAEDARDLMRRHLTGSRDRLFEGRELDLRL